MTLPTCHQCGTKLREPSPSSTCRFCLCDLILALADQSTTDRVEAAWYWRQQGHSAKAVVLASREAKQGRPAEEILARLEGLEAVAA